MVCCAMEPVGHEAFRKFSKIEMPDSPFNCHNTDICPEDEEYCKRYNYISDEEIETVKIVSFGKAFDRNMKIQ